MRLLWVQSLTAENRTGMPLLAAAEAKVILEITEVAVGELPAMLRMESRH